MEFFQFDERILPYDQIECNMCDISIVLKYEVIFDKMLELVNTNTKKLEQQILDLQARMILHYGYIYPIELSFCGNSMLNRIFSKMLYESTKKKFEHLLPHDDKSDENANNRVEKQYDDSFRILNPWPLDTRMKSASGCMEGAPNYLRLTADRDANLNKWLTRSVQIPMVFVANTTAGIFRFSLDKDVVLKPIGMSMINDQVLNNLEQKSIQVGNVVTSMHLSFYLAELDECIGIQFLNSYPQTFENFSIQKPVEVKAYEFD